MTKYAICLVADAQYMVPTIVAALQARAGAPGVDVDVFIFAMGLEPAKADRYRAICEPARVVIQLVSREVFGGEEDNLFIDAFFADSPFSFGALGRLFLDRLLPAVYEEILYLDGDVQVSGSIDDLLRLEVPAGRFLAAPDPKAFWIYANTPVAERERAYMAALGLTEGEYGGYFNSGVLRISRAGWREIGEAAWAFLRAKPELCVNHDQSALNSVGRSERLPMSLRWNFPPYYRYYGLEPRILPRIKHFMSRPKPWNGAFPPWSDREQQPYLDLVAAHPDLAPELHRFGPGLSAKYFVQQRMKRADERLHTERRRRVTAQVLAFESALAA